MSEFRHHAGWEKAHVILWNWYEIEPYYEDDPENKIYLDHLFHNIFYRKNMFPDKEIYHINGSISQPLQSLIPEISTSYNMYNM